MVLKSAKKPIIKNTWDVLQVFDSFFSVVESNNVE